MVLLIVIVIGNNEHTGHLLFNGVFVRRIRYGAGLAVLLLFGYTTDAQSTDGGSGGTPDVARLLAGFLENDIEIKELAIKARQAELGQRQTGIENGFDLTLSTGTMAVYTADGATTLSVTPKGEFSFPQLNGAKLDVTVPLTVSSDGNGDDVAVENAQVALSAALIGPAGKQRTVTLLKADRALLEARRALLRRGRTAEKAFYERLGSLYESAVQVLTLEDTAYTKEIDMAVARAQGHAPSSVRYRTVELEAAAAHRAAQEQQRQLKRDMSLFARDCGLGDAEAFIVLPAVLPQTDLETAPEFGTNGEREFFTEIEAARWARYIGALSREATGGFELSAEGGITANNTRVDGGVSADAGLTFGWRGISVSVGTQVPLTGSGGGTSGISSGGKPAFTLSLGFNAGKQRLGTLSGEEKALAAESEALALQTAERNWEVIVDAVRAERSSLVWERARLTEQHTLYRELAEDATAQYRDGLVTESEYRKALANEQRLSYEILAVDAKSLVHLINTGLYSVED
jgi:hypothetical protein